MAKPKILLYDIEISPVLAYAWPGRMYEVNLIKIVQPSYMMSFAYKWLGDPKVYCLSRTCYKDKTDRSLVAALTALKNTADLSIAHNGDAFDNKKHNTRILYHDDDPYKVLPSLDTKKLAKKYFSFDSNSLNDLAVFLGLGKKVKHTGFDMWEDCMAGKNRAWRLMRKYNKMDVILLEAVVERMRKWIQNEPKWKKLHW